MALVIVLIIIKVSQFQRWVSLYIYLKINYMMYILELLKLFFSLLIFADLMRVEYFCLNEDILCYSHSLIKAFRFMTLITL